MNNEKVIACFQPIFAGLPPVGTEREYLRGLFPKADTRGPGAGSGGVDEDDFAPATMELEPEGSGVSLAPQSNWAAASLTLALDDSDAVAAAALAFVNRALEPEATPIESGSVKAVPTGVRLKAVVDSFHHHGGSGTLKLIKYDVTIPVHRDHITLTVLSGIKDRVPFEQFLVFAPNEEVEVVLKRGSGKDENEELQIVEVTGPNKQPITVQQKSKRRRGVVRHWNQDRQYGFITPHASRTDVFFHGSMINWAPEVPHKVELGMLVEYTPVDRDGTGKHVAFAISDVDMKPLDPAMVNRVSIKTHRHRDGERKRDRDANGGDSGAMLGDIEATW